MADYEFPPGFIWGAATASYQIEGGVQEEGRGESIWDRFAHTPGKIITGDTGDVASDHFHRMREDVALMRDLGLCAYRFSIAWPRVLPQGEGPVNEAGLAFYDRLVDALLDAGILPFVTLYHWDLPQALQDKQDGWISRASVEQFVHYADIVSRRLGDRVKYWTTFNEPRIFITHGYITGEHAPGLMDWANGVRAAHHVLLAHGMAVPVLRANAGPDAQVGIVDAVSPVEAETDNPEVMARRQIVDAQTNHWFLDPIFLGRYPEELLGSPDFATLDIQPGDMETISAPLDFVGANYYTRIIVRATPGNFVVPVIPPADEDNTAAVDSEYERTALGWEVYPQGLYNVLERMHEDYHPAAIYVTENGAAYDDVVGPDGQVHDERRTAYLCEHFKIAWQAIEDGIPLRGYFVWSLIDNFEWAYGFSKRLGLVYVDYPTGRRIVKDSGRFYQSVIENNALPDEDD